MAEIIRPFPQRIDLGRPWVPTRAGDILELPPAPSWIWDGRIMRGQVTILGGDAKIGKSLLLQQLLSCAAMGIPCLGRHTERVRCFGYFAEDTENWLRTRQFAMNAALGIDMIDYDDRLQWKSMAIDDCVLADFEYGKMRLTPAWDQLWRVLDDEGGELIVIDNARAVFQGNETRASQVTPFVRELQKKAIEGERAIILAAHPPSANVGKGYAGSGAWLASARAGLSLQRPFDYDEQTDSPKYERILRGIGANYSDGRAMAKLRFDPESHIFIADEADDPPQRLGGLFHREVLDNELMRVLIAARTNGARVPAHVMSRGSLPELYRRTIDRRAALNDLYAGQDRLLAAGDIVRVNVRGECLLRQAKGKPYDDEKPWAV